MTVFLDSSAFLAILDQDDRANAAASSIWRALVEQGEHCITTNYVLVETNALIQRRLGIKFVHAFEEKVVPFLSIIWVNESLHQSSLQVMRVANRRRLSLVDCVSFAVCRQARVKSVFAFDAHFNEQGFEVLSAA